MTPERQKALTVCDSFNPDLWEKRALVAESENKSLREQLRVAREALEKVQKWSNELRGYMPSHGTYAEVSPKHLHLYIDEFTFRLNEGDVKRHTMRRLESFIDAIVGKRLTYERLIAKVGA